MEMRMRTVDGKEFKVSKAEIRVSRHGNGSRFFDLHVRAIWPKGRKEMTASFMGCYGYVVATQLFGGHVSARIGLAEMRTMIVNAPVTPDPLFPEECTPEICKEARDYWLAILYSPSTLDCPICGRRQSGHLPIAPGRCDGVIR